MSKKASVGVITTVALLVLLFTNAGIPGCTNAFKTLSPEVNKVSLSSCTQKSVNASLARTLVVTGSNQKLDAIKLPHEIRTRSVEISKDFGSIISAIPTNDLALQKMSEQKRSFAFELFEDHVVNIVVERIEASNANGFIIRGKVEGEADGSIVTLVFENGILVGNIKLGQDVYEIRPSTSGHVIKQIDTSKLDSDDPEPGSADWKAMFENADQSADAPSISAANKAAMLALANSTEVTTFDVLVAYTPDARASQGGDAGIMALAQLVVDQANQAYQNSLVYQRARLVGTYLLESNLSQSSGSAANESIKGKTDGKWDGIHAKRSAVGADLVAVITDVLPNSCGWADTSRTADQGFSFSKTSCLSNHSFTHELGHNMAAEHDRGNTSGDMYPAFAYGYVDVTHCFRDVMSYSNGCTVRVPYFSSSNPAVKYDGWPVGTATEDNARALNLQRHHIASLVAAVVPNSTPTPTPIPTATPKPVPTPVGQTPTPTPPEC